MQCPFVSHKPVTTSAARRARAASSRDFPPPEAQPAQFRLRVGHANAGSALLAATARTSHYGVAPKERGLLPVQYPSLLRGPIMISAAQRAHAAIWRILPTPERQPAQWRVRECHMKADCVLEATARTTNFCLQQRRKAFRR